MFNQDVVQEILEKLDIVEWIESYVELKRAGSEWKGLCPFHDEKTPSFTVRPSTQSFKCFGCQEGGDLITFVRTYENLSFVETIRRLAERAGVTLVEEEYDPRQAARRRQRDDVLKVQSLAADFFHRLLLKDRGPGAQAARDYLSGREISKEIALEWKLGYAPEDQRSFFHWASEQKLATDLLVEGGLAAWRDENNHSRGSYSRFRHRLMFPVMDEHANVIAFSGRVLSPNQKGGKYVNSPETMVFKKSRTLFGFHKTRRPITKTGHAIICEGQIDLISGIEAGIDNMVAPLGTALTEDHAKVLRRQAEEVTLCYDSDQAGLTAAGKAFRALAPKGMLVRLAFLPEGEDPDSYIRKHGGEAFRTVITTAPEYFDFHIDRKGSLLSSGPLRDRLTFARELAADIALVEEKMLQDSLINRIASKLGIGEAELRKQIANAAKAQRRTAINQSRREQNSGKQQQRPAQPITIENRSIRLLCRLILTDPNTKAKLQSEPIPDYFPDLPGTELLAKVWQGQFDPSNPASVHAFTAILSDTEQTAIQKIMQECFPGASADWLDECMLSLERQAIQNKITMQKARLGVEGLAPEEVTRLTKDLLDLQCRRNDVT